tara:strand:+ start:1146 stop:1784 length:639 start_codon:yes stop_codon:yes gene_type:complete
MVLGDNMEETLNFQIIGTAKELFEAWFNVKKKLGSHVIAAGKNPHFGNDYIMLDSLISKIDKACKENDLGIMQFPTGEGLITILLHKKSGHFIQSYYKLILDKQTPQGVGSALTYAKRQILQAMFGLSAGPEEDDDAEGSIERKVVENDDSEYKEKPPPTKTAFQLAKIEIKNIKSIEQLAEWWTGLPDAHRNTKQIRDLKDSRKAELNVKG